ncbi:hypothetical protein Tco_0832534 [Tanacetum coccineum]
MAWISWKNVLTSKRNGGLGVSSFYALNRAFESFNSIAKRSTWLDIVREVSTLSTKGFLMEKYGDLNVGELAERMQQDKGSGKVDSLIETARRIVATVFGVSITSLLEFDALTRRIEAGDCEDTLDRLTNDERKAAMDTFTVWGANLLAHMSDLNLIMLMEHMVSVSNTGNVVANAFNNGLGTSSEKIQSSLEKFSTDMSNLAKNCLERSSLLMKIQAMFQVMIRPLSIQFLSRGRFRTREHSMCIDSWGRSSFARCLIVVRADETFKDSVSVGIPLPEIFGHVYDQCPNNVTIIPTVDKMNKDGFQAVKVRYELKAHGNFLMNGAPKVSTSAKDDPSKKLHAKKGGPHVHTCKPSVPTSN